MVRFVLAAMCSATLVACDGEQGPPGPAGPVEGAVSNRFCRMQTGSLYLQYQIVRYASGDMLVICSVSDAASHHTDSIYYRNGDTGTADALCWVYHDFDAATGGYWNFQQDGSGERAAFYDPDPASIWDGTVWTFPGGACAG